MQTEARRRLKPKITPPAVLDARQRYSIAEAAAILRQSIPQTFVNIREGKLHSFKDGARTYISGAELIRESQPPESSAA